MEDGEECGANPADHLRKVLPHIRDQEDLPPPRRTWLPHHVRRLHSVPVALIGDNPPRGSSTRGDRSGSRGGTSVPANESPSMDPLELAKELATELDALDRRRPSTVAIDGPDGSGTAVVADRLAAAIRTRGRTVVRLHSHEFLRPRRIRDRRGNDSPEGFLEDTVDVAAIRQLVLEPLARGERRIIPKIHDPGPDAPVDPHFEEVPDDAVVIMEGQLLLRKGIREDWSLRVELTISEEERLRRVGQGLPASQVPAEGAESDRNHRRARGFALYLERDDPVAAADIVIDTTNPERPVPIRWP